MTLETAGKAIRRALGVDLVTGEHLRDVTILTPKGSAIFQRQPMVTEETKEAELRRRIRESLAARPTDRDLMTIWHGDLGPCAEWNLIDHHAQARLVRLLPRDFALDAFELVMTGVPEDSQDDVPRPREDPWSWDPAGILRSTGPGPGVRRVIRDRTANSPVAQTAMRGSSPLNGQSRAGVATTDTLKACDPVPSRSTRMTRLDSDESRKLLGCWSSPAPGSKGMRGRDHEPGAAETGQHGFE